MNVATKLFLALLGVAFAETAFATGGTSTIGVLIAFVGLVVLVAGGVLFFTGAGTGVVKTGAAIFVTGVVAAILGLIYDEAKTPSRYEKQPSAEYPAAGQLLSFFPGDAQTPSKPRT